MGFRHTLGFTGARRVVFVAVDTIGSDKEELEFQWEAMSGEWEFRISRNNNLQSHSLRTLLSQL